MVEPLTMAAGQELLLNDLVVDWTSRLLDSNPPSVMLTASVQIGPNPSIAQNLRPKATTLAVQMDAWVAIGLYEKLGELIQSMGWQTVIRDAGQV